jgi:hypothetical protein
METPSARVGFGILPKDSADTKLVHFLNQAAGVVANQLAQHLADHCGI